MRGSSSNLGTSYWSSELGTHCNDDEQPRSSSPISSFPLRHSKTGNIIVGQEKLLKMERILPNRSNSGDVSSWRGIDGFNRHRGQLFDDLSGYIWRIFNDTSCACNHILEDHLRPLVAWTSTPYLYSTVLQLVQLMKLSERGVLSSLSWSFLLQPTKFDQWSLTHNLIVMWSISTVCRISRSLAWISELLGCTEPNLDSASSHHQPLHVCSQQITEIFLSTAPHAINEMAATCRTKPLYLPEIKAYCVLWTRY